MTLLYYSFLWTLVALAICHGPGWAPCLISWPNYWSYHVLASPWWSPNLTFKCVIICGVLPHKMKFTKFCFHSFFTKVRKSNIQSTLDNKTFDYMTFSTHFLLCFWLCDTFFTWPNLLVQNYPHNTTMTHDSMIFENPILSYFKSTNEKAISPLLCFIQNTFINMNVIENFK